MTLKLNITEIQHKVWNRSSWSGARSSGRHLKQTDGKMYGRTDGGKDGYDKSYKPYAFSRLCVRPYNGR